VAVCRKRSDRLCAPPLAASGLTSSGAIAMQNPGKEAVGGEFVRHHLI
jgi:hypothetical protein